MVRTRTTQNDHTIYLHLSNLPAGNAFAVHGITSSVATARLLAANLPLRVIQTGSMVVLDLSAIPRSTLIPVIALDIAPSGR